MYYDETMRDQDAEQFKASAIKEIRDLEKHKTWRVVPQSVAQSKGKQIIPSTWNFRRKRRPNGDVKKHKGRFCVRGDLQKDVPDTYSPVVQWSTIRAMMFFALSMNLETRCIDFSNVFVQAPLDDPIYVHLPRGFRRGKDKNGQTILVPGYSDTRDCLELRRSLYGTKSAPRLISRGNCFQHH